MCMYVNYREGDDSFAVKCRHLSRRKLLSFGKKKEKGIVLA